MWLNIGWSQPKESARKRMQYLQNKTEFVNNTEKSRNQKNVVHKNRPVFNLAWGEITNKKETTINVRCLRTTDTPNLATV